MYETVSHGFCDFGTSCVSGAKYVNVTDHCLGQELGRNASRASASFTCGNAMNSVHVKYCDSAMIQFTLSLYLIFTRSPDKHGFSELSGNNSQIA
jgi:hypothetical protein